MKRRISLTEGQLRNIIKESVRRIINEKHRPTGISSTGKRIFRDGTTYYPAQNLGKYADAQDLDQQTMYKAGCQVRARQGISGKRTKGTMLGNFVERDGYLEDPEHMEVINPGGEQYKVPKKEFDTKYTLAPGSQPDNEGFNTYNVFDKRQISSPVRHNVYTNMPNWGKGEKQFGRRGDAHIVNPNSKNPYYIGDNELRQTHTNNPNISN